MKPFLLVCSGFLLLGVASLPIGFYTFLRIITTIGSMVVVITEFKNGINFWLITFGITCILFNPFFPIYFHDKQVWIPIDIACAILFLIKSITIKEIKN